MCALVWYAHVSCALALTRCLLQHLGILWIHVFCSVTTRTVEFEVERVCVCGGNKQQVQWRYASAYASAETPVSGRQTHVRAPFLGRVGAQCRGSFGRVIGAVMHLLSPGSMFHDQRAIQRSQPKCCPTAAKTVCVCALTVAYIRSKCGADTPRGPSATTSLQ